MKLRARLGTRKDVRHESADNRTDDTEPDRPHKRQVHVHERFCSPPGDQTNDDVPNQMKHDVSSFEFRIGGYQADKPETMRIMRPTRPPLQHYVFATVLRLFAGILSFSPSFPIPQLLPQ